MPNLKGKIVISFLLIFCLLEPGLSLAQEMPQTIEEAENVGKNILEQLPGAIKEVWHNQALPTFAKMWVWVKNVWENGLGAKVKILFGKIWSLTGEEPPDVEKIGEEFQKEKQEMRQDLWERFKKLLE